ncbi:CoA-transferase family III [compost metagenome]
MLNAALTLMAPVYASELVSGHKVPRSRSTAFSGSPLSGTFAVRDGHLAIVCNAQDQALGLMAALRDAGVTEADVQGLARVAGEGLVDEAQQKLGGWLARDSGAVWLERLGRHGVPAAIATDPIQAVRAACHDWPEVDLPTAGGATRRIRVPGIGFASTEPVTGALRPPPRRGEHSRRWLESAGLEKDDIDRLFQEGKAHGSAA